MKRFISFIFASVFISSVIFAVPRLSDGYLPSGPKPDDRPSVALVLAGGGAKGFAHLPVIELIEEIGIPIDMIVGTSIGSIIGGMYSAGYSTTEILKNFSEVDWSQMFRDSAKSPYEKTLKEHSLEANIASINLGMDFSMKLGTGISNGQTVYQLLKEMTLKYPSNSEFDNLPIPFRAVVTDMLTGNSMVLDEGDIAEAIRASMSLPSIFAPYEIDGYHFMDGGVRYNLAINVAKNMGYDIIIAVDISQKVRDNPDVYSSNPIVAMLNTITIAQYTATESMYKDAALVIFPDISKYGTLDFKKAEQIYNEGKKILSECEKPLENIRKKIYPQDYDSKGNRISSRKKLQEKGPYSSIENLVPARIEIEGALESDEGYISHNFEKIQGQELNSRNFQRFVDSVYLTGNYDNVRTRVYQTDQGTVLHLLLHQNDKSSMKIITGFDLQQIIAPTSMTAFTMNLEYQLRGLTGPGSLVALRGNAINNYGLSLYYLQPFNPYIFVETGLSYKDRRYPEMPLKWNFDDNSTYYSRKNFTGDFDFGIRTENGNLIRAGGYYHSKSICWADALNSGEGTIHRILWTAIENAVNTSTDLSQYEWYTEDLDYIKSKYAEKNDVTSSEISGLYTSQNFGGFLEYNLNKLDSQVFPHKGFSLVMEANLDFAFTERCVNRPSLALSIDANGAIPFNKNLSLNPSVFLGSDVLGTMESNPLLLLGSGYSTYDRIYFPQTVNESRLGSTKAAAGLSLLIQPWNQLTILGGDAIILISGTVGQVVCGWNKIIPQSEEDWKTEPVLWSASAGFGIKIKENYNILLRMGAANKNRESIFPFFTLDIGSINF